MHSSPTARQIGVEVQAQMLRKGMTTETLAEVMGCSARTAQRRLNGDDPFDFTELASVAAALNTPLSTLVAEAREVIAA